MTTLQEHIDHLNEKAIANGSCFTLAPAEHFEEMGITTVEEFNDYMDIAAYRDWYKDRHGCRPRHPITAEEARRQMDRWAEEEKEEEEYVYKEEPVPANNVFAELLK